MRWIPVAPLLVCNVFALSQDFGPIATRNHRATSLAFLRFEPCPNLLSFGQRTWEASITSANDLRVEVNGSKIVDEDYEVQRLALRYRQGLKRGMEWSVEVPILSRGGGFQDPLIDWWHANVLHWSDPTRDSAPIGRSSIRLPGGNSFGSASGLGDISVTLSKSLGGIIGSIGLKIPTGNAGSLLGSGAFDAGFYLQLQRPILRKVSLHVQAGLVWQGEARELPDTRRWVHQEGFGLVWQPNSRDAWIAQWQGEASALELGVPGSDATHRMLTIGYRRKLSSKQMLDLYFSEDRDVFNGNFPEGANVGPDFTLGIRLGVKF
ncbi:MAG: DUF3187 family protein [Chlorobia bacterium]|nr:DUF3187 family protein [Fimbriimonadaceae bacterium]